MSLLTNRRMKVNKAIEKALDILKELNWEDDRPDIKEAMDDLEALDETINTLEKELKSAKMSYQYYSDKNGELTREIEGIHHILDNLVPCPPRGKDDEEHSWKNVTYSVITRLAIWLGSKQ